MEFGPAYKFLLPYDRNSDSPVLTIELWTAAAFSHKKVAEATVDLTRISFVSPHASSPRMRSRMLLRLADLVCTSSFSVVSSWVLLLPAVVPRAFHAASTPSTFFSQILLRGEQPRFSAFS